MKNFIYILLIIFLNFTHISADTPHFIDFKYILNESNAGKKAQDYLKSKLDNGLKSLKEKEKKFKQRKKLIQQKN